MFKSLIVTKSKEKSYLKQKRNEFPKFDSDKYVPLRLKDFSKLKSGAKLKLAFFDFIENKWKNFTFEYTKLENSSNLFLRKEEKRIIGKSKTLFAFMPPDYRCLKTFKNSNFVYYSTNSIYSPIFRKLT